MANPMGSINAWHPAQAGSARCCAILSRIEITFSTPAFSFNAGTLPGGGGGATPRIFANIHLPRMTGEVRFAYEVKVRMLPWPNRPPRRGLRSDSTFRTPLPETFEIL